MLPITTKLTGVTIGEAQKNIQDFVRANTGICDLFREPQNAHDPNAIRVESNGKYLGYIPKDVAAKLAPLMDSGTKVRAEFVQRNESPFHAVVGLTLRIVRVA